MTVAAMVVDKKEPKLGGSAEDPEEPQPYRESRAQRAHVPRKFLDGEAGRLSLAALCRAADHRLPTKIDGTYDFAVSLVDSASSDPGDVKRAIGMATRDGSFARMIAEGIGMKLETRKGPVEMIVVDSADKSPTEN